MEKSFDISFLNFNKIAYRLLISTASVSFENTSINFDNLKLNSVQIKNFKGFKECGADDRGCKIDIHKNKTIIFAPNGGGKTSFCEALEYKLTGEIKEAKRRGYGKNLNSYFENSDNNEVINLFNDSFDNLSESDKEYFKTCFIEKNRIQEFALLGSKDTDTKEKDVIAILFGLEDLLELTTRFVQPTSFKIEQKNTAQEKLKNLENTNTKNLTKQKTRTSDISSKKKEVCTLFSLQEIDYGTELYNQKKQDLQSTISELEKLVKPDSNKPLQYHSKNDIMQSCTDVQTLFREYQTLQSELNQQKQNVDFKNLYNAINEFSNRNLSACPACDTPLNKVVRNPFEKASKELENLKEISEKSTKLEQQLNNILSKYNDIIKLFLNTCHSNLKDNKMSNVDMSNKITSLSDILGNDKNNPEKQLELTIQVCEYVLSNPIPSELESYFTQLEKIQKEQVEKQSSIQSNQQKLDQAKGKSKEVDLLERQLKEFEDELIQINDALTHYQSQKSALQIEVKKENQFNTFLNQVQSAYKNFYKDLLNFKSKVEEQNFDGIQDTATKYYQAINKHDTDAEQIKKIKFVKEGDNYRIKLILKNNTQEQDAFACLSEGHTRALGLSLMLAVAKDKPFFIFDDVVNAIDTEHRANIIEMIFNDKTLKKKQMIITTHDRLFWERFCNESSKRNTNNYSSYLFTTSKNCGVSHKSYNVAFEAKIQQALNDFDIRQALVYCRIWFETMAKDFCIKEKKKAEGYVSEKGGTKYINISIESIYKILENHFSTNPNQNLTNLRSKFSFTAQNQEAHAFSEHNYNFIHSQTSIEVQEIFNWLKELNFDLFATPNEKKIREIQVDIKKIEEKLEKCNSRLLYTKEETERQSKTEEKANLETQLQEKQTELNQLNQ
ncbi:MAG: AAA family ATPase [Bernardetiaceae bacterium]|nr:AAA family ATPase [Bernardetiaceae bacterium]